MDLPKCPACGQSVLDDVDTCPFCGAPMKGGSAQKPKTPSPSQASGTSGKSAAGTGAGKPETGRKSAASAAQPTGPKPTAPKKSEAEGEEDEVISFDGAALRRAIPLARKPSRGRMMRVVCPMCDTPGFAPKEAAGKEVKCVNPNCLVPIFRAPELKKEEPKKQPEEEEPQKKSSLGLYLLISILIVGVGAGVWFFVFSGAGQQKQQPLTAQGNAGAQGKTQQANSTEQQAAAGAQQSAEKKKETEKTKPAIPPIDPAKVTNVALQKMVQASRRRERNRSKPYCRQLTARAYACIGDIQNAKQQIEQLKLVGRDVPYYQISAWTALAQAQMKAGDEQGARQSIEAAWKLRNQIPTYGQTGADAAVDLAVLLTAAGRLKDAVQLVEEHAGQSSHGQIATLIRMAFGDKSYDVDQTANLLPVGGWKEPEWVAVTVDLTVQKKLEQALEWVRAVPTAFARADAMSVWAAAAVREALAGGQKFSVETLQEALKPLPPAYQAKVLARTAYVAAQVEGKELTQQLLTLAHQAMDNVPAKEPFVIPPMLQLYEMRLPSPDSWFAAAEAAAEISRTEALVGKTDEAVKALQLSLAYLRGAAPALEAAVRKDQEFNRLGRSTIESTFKKALRLETHEQARLAANRYRKKCHDLLGLAKQRWELQLAILSRAADWIPLEKLWTEIQEGATAQNDDLREPYFQSWLPDRLACLAETSGKAQLAESIRKALKSDAPKDQRIRLQQTMLKYALNGRPQQAAKALAVFLKKNRRDPRAVSWAELWTLRLVCRMIAQPKTVKDSFVFIQSLENQLWRETAFQVAAAMCASQGIGGYAWNFVQQTQLPSTEEVSLLYGLIVGLTNPQ